MASAFLSLDQGTVWYVQGPIQLHKQWGKIILDSLQILCVTLTEFLKGVRLPIIRLDLWIDEIPI